MAATCGGRRESWRVRRPRIYENIVLEDIPQDQGQSQDQEEQDLPVCTFQQFAAENFKPSISAKHTKGLIKEPLLPTKDEADSKLALSIWPVIQRFMGDRPDNAKSPSSKQAYISVMTRLEQIHKSSRGALKDLFSNACIKKAQKGGGILRLMKKRLRKQGEEGEPCVEDSLLTPLNKIHYIVGNGIYRNSIRDEVYCQICKQLIENPSSDSRERGWLLLAVCLGSFLPSEQLIPCVTSFLDEAPTEKKEFCLERFYHTKKMGTRAYPPGSQELQACECMKLCSTEVHLADGSSLSFPASPSTTVGCVEDNLCEVINLQDKIGFTLCISTLGRMCSLASTDRILDIISHGEQLSLEEASLLNISPLNRIEYRKVFFTPWSDLAADKMATNLIYDQIKAGVKQGDLVCEDEMMASLAAQVYYIEHREGLDNKIMQTLLGSLLPTTLLSSPQHKAKWVQTAQQAYMKGVYRKNGISRANLKQQFISWTKNLWVRSFSCLFALDHVIGPGDVTYDDVIMAVNHQGVQVLTGEEDVILQWAFIEIKSVSHSPVHKESVKIVTFQDEVIIFTTTEYQAVMDLLSFLLEGLQERSRFALANQDLKALDPLYLSLEVGDVIELKTDGGTVVKQDGYYYGTNLRSSQRGFLNEKSVHILPVQSKPSQKLLESFKQKDLKPSSIKITELNPRSSLSI